MLVAKDGIKKICELLNGVLAKRDYVTFVRAAYSGGLTFLGYFCIVL